MAIAPNLDLSGKDTPKPFAQSFAPLSAGLILRVKSNENVTKRGSLTLQVAHGRITALPPPSSSGLGRGPLKAETGVRFPLGAQAFIARTIRSL
jgi:hypothetical protein